MANAVIIQCAHRFGFIIMYFVTSEKFLSLSQTKKEKKVSTKNITARNRRESMNKMNFNSLNVIMSILNYMFIKSNRFE